MFNSVASFQLTGSKNFWAEDGIPLGDPADAKYVSPSGRLVIPLWLRSSFEISGDFVRTNQVPSPGVLKRTYTTDVSMLYLNALSKFSPAFFGDWTQRRRGQADEREHGFWTSGVQTF